MTVENTVYNLSEVEFCQMNLIHTGSGPIMVRKIQKAREKDSMSIIPLTSEKVFRKWMGAVGECGLALSSGVPIMQSMYECYKRHGVASRLGESVAMQSGSRILAKGLESRWAPVTDEARADVFTAWDITPDEQRVIEGYYDRLQLKYSTRGVDNLRELHHARL
jgi:hypothetical protein